MSIDDTTLEIVATAIRIELRRRLSDKEKTTLAHDGEVLLECKGKSVSLAAKTRLELPPNAFYTPGAKREQSTYFRLLFPRDAAEECVERGKRWASNTHALLIVRAKDGQRLPKVAIVVSVDEGRREPKLVLKLP